MKRGLTLGKYAPLHRGHQFVIETALAEMDETIVLIYDAPETTDVPLAVRSRWLRELYPSLRVIEAWDGPTEVGYTTELRQAHERYVIENLGVRDITHFYSSERYGEHMSEALGAEDRRVDETRARFPVSASDIRHNAFGFREFVSPIVYRDFIINVVFLGAPSTGKTTLAKRLAHVLDTQWMPEYGREIWEKYQVNRRLTAERLVEIAAEHIKREDSLLAESNRYLFTDTNAMTTATFARYYHGVVGSRLTDLAARAMRRYDLTFVCDIDIPYENTWDRSGDANRAAFQRQVVAGLNENKIPFITLRGTLEDRVAHVQRVLKHFRKYMNPFDLCGTGSL